MCKMQFSLRAELYKLQTIIQLDPLNSLLADKERLLSEYPQAKLDDEESFLCQKSRIDWLQLGDRNSKFFHASFETRKSRNSNFR
jgi:hypothetical protein